MTHDDGREARTPIRSKRALTMQERQGKLDELNPPPRETTCEDVSSDVPSLADAIAARRRLSEAQPETLIPRATVTLMLDVLSAANRRRQAIVRWGECQGWECRLHESRMIAEHEQAEDAALDALAAHWGVGGDE